MAPTIEQYSKTISYVVDVAVDDITYAVFINYSHDNSTPTVAVINGDDGEIIASSDPCYDSVLAAAEAEILSRNGTDTTQLLQQIIELSNPLLIRDAEELFDALTAINKLATNGNLDTI